MTSLVLRKRHRSTVSRRARWSTRRGSNARPLIVQALPWCEDSSSPNVHVCDTFAGTGETSFGDGRRDGSREASRAGAPTRNSMTAVSRASSPEVPLAAGTDASTRRWPVAPLKSTITSARWAGPSSTPDRTTALGSRPLPVPICRNGRPSDSVKL